jgi:hypothetical protein
MLHRCIIAAITGVPVASRLDTELARLDWLQGRAVCASFILRCS